jgi:hypothetical protein
VSARHSEPASLFIRISAASTLSGTVPGPAGGGGTLTIRLPIASVMDAAIRWAVFTRPQSKKNTPSLPALRLYEL